MCGSSIRSEGLETLKRESPWWTPVLSVSANAIVRAEAIELELSAL